MRTTAASIAAALGLWAAAAGATPSPNPVELMPVAYEVSVPAPAGASRGAYADFRAGALLFDSGAGGGEETVPGESRRWVFQATGTLTVGRATYAVTCFRASRVNVQSPTAEYYFELRLSALDGSCTAKTDARSVELVFTMSDFVIRRFRDGQLRFFGPLTALQLYPAVLRVPEGVTVRDVDGQRFVSGELAEVPAVAELRVELLLRPKGQASCQRGKFDPEKDPYSSVLVLPAVSGRWAATVPPLGGAVCARLVGGGWRGPVIAARTVAN